MALHTRVCDYSSVDFIQTRFAGGSIQRISAGETLVFKFMFFSYNQHSAFQINTSMACLCIIKSMLFIQMKYPLWYRKKSARNNSNENQRDIRARLFLRKRLRLGSILLSMQSANHVLFEIDFFFDSCNLWKWSLKTYRQSTGSFIDQDPVHTCVISTRDDFADLSRYHSCLLQYYKTVLTV